ncbi:MAG: 4-oxalmesaconate hydratase [Candidatus Hydrogenedentes bacterium ADurb.Bin179]|nr:MAG: 4-oxalmesaconate hydratase [Candidatus Hydrogenedentes bacterium ADurb.Bin179]
MSGKVLAVGAHPDDVEFMMAGTLLVLAEAGYEPHIFVVASGSCGSMVIGKDELVRTRLKEAKAAAEQLKAQFYAPVVDDLEVTYSVPLLRKVAAVVREVQPDIVLTHSPDEYMEDHTITARLTVTAVFSRGMPNFLTDPDRPIYNKDVVLYQCLPYGLCDTRGRRVEADCYVDITRVMDTKTRALSCHESQRNWLDTSQRMDSYVQSMQDMSLEVGRLSRHFKAAEGWRYHNYRGFCSEGANPLAEALRARFLPSQEV